MVSIRRPSPITRPSEGWNLQDNESPPRINNAPSSSASTFLGFFNSTMISSVRLLTSGVFGLQGRTPFTTRKHQQSTLVMSKKWLFRVLFFFTIGSLLGLSSVFHHYMDTSHDFSFDQKSSQFLGASHSTNDLFADPVSGSLNLATGRAIETVDDDYPDEPVQTESIVQERGMWEQTVEPKKLLIIITPTYNRPLQGYYLARLGQTLRLVPKQLLWIVIENGVASMETAEILRMTGVMYRHLVCRKNLTTNLKDRGVYQRNEALDHIERHKMDGIVYFADDDNIYPLELFESLREIRRFGTWPVAMLAKSKSRTILEGPVCNGSQVIGWHTNEKSKKLRRFHVDMSGFAFNSTMLWDPMRWHRPASDIIRQLDIVKEGFQETTFIEQMIEDESQMEALPSSCTKIMIWHLHIDIGGIHPRGWKLPSNLEAVIPLN